MAVDGEELLDTRPPRSRRGLLIGAAALVTVAAVAVVATRSGSNPHPAPSSARPAPTLPSRPPVAVTSSDVVAVAVGDTVYAVDAGAVITVDLNTGARAVLRPSAGDPPDTRYNVLADPDHQRLWVVRAHGTDIEVWWFDTSTLMQTGAESDIGELQGVAVLDGRLYLSTPHRVLAISQTEEVPAPRPPAIRPGEVIAADPARHRLLVVRYGAADGALIAQEPGGPTPLARAPAPFGKGDLTVTGGRIWAVGFGDSHAVVERLDPRTLRVQLRSPLEQHLGPGAVLMQTGSRHLLVRESAGAGELWCLDAATGAVTRHWAQVDGTAVLAEAGVFSLVGGEPLQRVDSSGCSGG